MLDKIKMKEYNNLVENISQIVVSAQSNIAKTINKTMVFTYWNIGKYIVEFEQGGEKRAKYGTELLKKIAIDLTSNIGKGFSWRNLYNMKRFYIEFPILQTLSAKLEIEKLQTVSAKSEDEILAKSIDKLNWSHFVRLLGVKDNDERNFYIIETAQNRWSERELDR